MYIWYFNEILYFLTFGADTFAVWSIRSEIWMNNCVEFHRSITTTLNKIALVNILEKSSAPDVKTLAHILCAFFSSSVLREGMETIYRGFGLVVEIAFSQVLRTLGRIMENVRRPRLEIRTFLHFSWDLGACGVFCSQINGPWVIRGNSSITAFFLYAFHCKANSNVHAIYIYICICIYV